MNKYITMYNEYSHGYQIIARSTFNQTFDFRKDFHNLPVMRRIPNGRHIIYGKFDLTLKSDFNYQLAIL